MRISDWTSDVCSSDLGVAGCGFQEISPRRSDFALASAAAQLVMGADGSCRRAAAGIGGACATPMRVDEAADLLVGTAVEDADIACAVEAAISIVEAEGDLHATSDYRRRVGGVMLERAKTGRASVCTPVSNAH